MRNLPSFTSNRNGPFDVFEEMNRWLNQNFDVPSAQDAGFGALPTDFHEDANQYLLTLDIPGMKKEDIKIELNENILTISGERKREDSDKSSRRSERSYGFFQRSFSLPSTVMADKVEAHYADGVLELVIPKAEASKARRIEIQGGKSGAFGRLLNQH